MRHDGRGDEGAVAVTVALFLVILVLMAGFVLDLGLARFDRHANQTAADLAATAAVNGLDRDQPDAYEAACQRAVDYFLANNAGVGPVAGDPCAIFADASFTCSAAGAATTATVLVEPYELYVTVPVLDDDPMMAGQTLNPAVDGYDPCSRVGVRIVRERDHLFAGVIGSDSSRPTSDAVGRTTAEGTDPEYATLVVLDPHGTGVITLNGNGTAVIIEDYHLDEDGDGTVDDILPGILTLDSDGTDDLSRHLLSPSANNSRICAGVHPDTANQIFTAANANDRPACDSTPDTLLTESEVGRVAEPTAYDLPKPQVDPFPIQRGRITRQPIDHRYNCEDDYYSPGYADVRGKRHHPVDEADDTDVAPCGSSATRRPHIDDLVAAYGNLAAADIDLAEPEWLSWTVLSGNAACRNAVGVHPPGNYYVNCPGNQGFSPVAVDFVGPGTIVFSGHVNVKGTLRINTSNTADTTVFLQEGGDLSDTGAVLTQLNRTFVYLEDGVTNLKNGVLWDAPRDVAYDVVDDDGNVVTLGKCSYTSGDAPPPSCFQNLALWANSQHGFDVGGSAVFNLDGIFFSPNAGRASGTEWFKLHGGPGYRLEHAQFFTYSLLLDGGAVLTMRPDPDRFEATPVVGGGLIR